MPVLYNKLPLTYDQQVQKLITNGMIIHNKAWAKTVLQKYGYYRLSAYWYPYRVRDRQGMVTSRFSPGTTFEDAINLYYFDCKLRALILAAIEVVEPVIRTSITYHMAHTYGAFGLYNPKTFHPQFTHVSFVTKLDEDVKNSSDQFIYHFKNKYQSYPQIPIWMATELMTLGAISKMYSGLQNDPGNSKFDKKAVADTFGLHHKQFGSWLHVLTYIRNTCAHHGRVWNKKLIIRPPAIKSPDWNAPITPSTDRVFYILLMIKTLLNKTGYEQEWVNKINCLVDPMFKKEDKWRHAMGFPQDWRSHPIWSN